MTVAQRTGVGFSGSGWLRERAALVADWSPAVWLFWALLGGSILALAAAPWPAAAKFHAILHGLCAQRPSHSFALGGTNLPFDARMTGIYGGALVTMLFLSARGRWRAVRRPTTPLVLALVAFAVAMGVDGVNSTLQDFRLPYLYPPNNHLRLITGLLMGVALGVTMMYLLGVTLWTWVRDEPALGGWRELAGLLALVGGFYLLVVSGWGWLYLPLAIALATGAVLVVLTLALCFLTLAYGRENRAARPADLAGFATLALVLGYAVMALIAAARFYLELSLGVTLPG
jgi:uncharacterized membrane protein